MNHVIKRGWQAAGIGVVVAIPMSLVRVILLLINK